jgi:tRNA uridine 5-carboxymethylaminomethyl modification enzyme
MIDDLVTRGVTEPYRMFTSRAEYRLSLRADNADQRLTDLGIKLGCVGAERRRQHSAKMADLVAVREYAKSVSVTPTEANRHGLSLNRDGQRRSAFEILSYPVTAVDDLARIWPKFNEFALDILKQVEIDAKYAVYLDRQAADISAYRRDESLLLPGDLDYGTVAGLSNECRQKLASVRPHTLGQASRLDGMTPAALTVLAAHVRRRERAAGHC